MTDQGRSLTEEATWIARVGCNRPYRDSEQDSFLYEGAGRGFDLELSRIYCGAMPQYHSSDDPFDQATVDIVNETPDVKPGEVTLAVDACDVGA